MKMKRFLYTFLMAAVAISANAQYQLGNSDFEQWEEVSYSGKTGEEPLLWSSFLDGTGSLKGMAGAVQLWKSTDTRPGTKGHYSAEIKARNVMFGIIAQGNLTTGCVNMGSTTATDASGNYNYINESRTDQSMCFSGHPDAARYWVKFNGKNDGKVSITLTTKGYFQDPQANNITATVVASSIKSTPSNSTWTQYTVPFDVKDSSRDPYYVLVNISTSAIAGDGAESDHLYVDDLEMLYYSEAKSITYDGQDILGRTKMDCLFDPDKLTDVKMTGRAATWSYSFDYNAYALTVTVRGENFSEDASNFHSYTISFTKPNADISSAIQDGVDLLTNSQDVIYNKERVQLTFNDDVKSHTETFDINTCQLTVVMTDISGNKITRIIQFHVPAPAIRSATWKGEPVNVDAFTTTDLYSESDFVLIGNEDATLVRSFDEGTLLLTVTAQAAAGYDIFNRVYTYQFGLGQMPDPRDEVIEPVKMEKNKQYYIKNKYHDKYVMDNNTLSSGEGTDLTKWTVTSNNYVQSSNGKYFNITINYNIFVTAPTSVSYSVNSTSSTAMDIQQSVGGYIMSSTATWTAWFVERSYQAFLSWHENAADGPDGTNNLDVYGKEDPRYSLAVWQFYDCNEVDCRNLRIELYDELTRAQQMGMDITSYRQVMNKNATNKTVLSDLLATVRAAQFNFVDKGFTEDRTSLLGSTDLTNSTYWNTNMSKNTTGGHHWDGTMTPYYEQSASPVNYWESSSPWTSSASQTVKLPAGHYMVKATARASQYAQSYIKVGDQSVSFPSKGDTGRGVDVNGNVNFRSDGTYANNNVGRGWEYRYLAFDVMNPNDNVTVEIGGSCEGIIHQWISISNIQLLAKPAPEMKMLSYTYDDKTYTPSSSNTIDMSDVFWKEEIIPAVETAGYGVYECKFDSVQWQMHVTLSQEEGINYGYAPIQYTIQYHKPAPGLTTLMFDGEDILNASTVDKYYNASLLTYSTNQDTQKTQLSFNRKANVLTIVTSGYNLDNTYVISFKDASAVSTEFTEMIAVTINQEASEPEESTVYTRENGDGTFDFELPNFQLIIDGEAMPIGTIVLSGITMINEDGVTTFKIKKTVTIAAGDKKGISTDEWFGPWLGDIPIDLNVGKIYAGRLYCELDIDMQESLGQTIKVVVGTDKDAYLVGDANGNGEVEIGDITSVLTLMATPDDTGFYDTKAADANKNGEIEIGDVTTILAIMAGN